jgi:hypothetical protein
MKIVAAILFILSCLVVGVVVYLDRSREPVAVDAVPAVPAVTNPPDTDAALQAEADDLLSFFDSMPSVPVYLSDEPIKKDGTNTERGVAYTNCDDMHVPSIVFKRDFRDRVNDKQRTNILKHELTHAWLCRKRLMNGHDELFRRKFESIGGFGN